MNESGDWRTAPATPGLVIINFSYTLLYRHKTANLVFGEMSPFRQVKDILTGRQCGGIYHNQDAVLQTCREVESHQRMGGSVGQQGPQSQRVGLSSSLQGSLILNSTSAKCQALAHH